MKKDFTRKIIIAGAILFSFFPLACKKNNSSPYGNDSGGGNPGANQVYMQGIKFNPSQITVAKGTTVTWTNMENVTHTVTSSTGLFDSGDMANGKTFSYKFSDAGKFSYYCRHHSGMTGTVTVQ